jgi:hypothetical protein
VTTAKGGGLDATDYARRHLRIGWWALAVFGGFGLILEALHGFKIAAYLDVSNDTRRLMWRLAHAHGTLAGAINVLFALTLRTAPAPPPQTPRISTLLAAATVVLPAGFFLGGVVVYGGDPGLGALLVPLGAVLLIAALTLAARAH